MKSEFLVVADLGCLKAYAIHYDPLDITPRVEPVDAFYPLAAHTRISEELSDQAGRFPKGGAPQGGPAGQSIGERSTLEREERRRLAKLLAEKIEELTRDHHNFFFAAPKEINAQIVSELSSECREKIRRNLPLDLTKIERSELLERFQ